MGGLNNELSDLKNKWNNSNLSNTLLSAISVALSNITGLKYQDLIGDGVVELSSQKGDGYKNVNVLPPIIGNNGVMIIPPIMSMWKPYHHLNTTELPGVINQIDSLIGRAS